MGLNGTRWGYRTVGLTTEQVWLERLPCKKYLSKRPFICATMSVSLQGAVDQSGGCSMAGLADVMPVSAAWTFRPVPIETTARRISDKMGAAWGPTAYGVTEKALLTR